MFHALIAATGEPLEELCIRLAARGAYPPQTLIG